MNDSRHLPSGLSRNIPNLCVVWDLYERARTQQPMRLWALCALPIQQQYTDIGRGLREIDWDYYTSRKKWITAASFWFPPSKIQKCTFSKYWTIIVWKCVWNDVCKICLCKTIRKQFNIGNNDSKTKIPSLNYLLRYISYIWMFRYL